MNDVLRNLDVRKERTEHFTLPKPKPMSSMRSGFEHAKNTLEAVIAGLTEEQMSRLSNESTSMAEKRRLVMETLARVGKPVSEKDLS